jgi:integrase
MVKPSCQLVAEYLDSKKDLWTPNTVKAAASRLMQYSPNQTPTQLYSHMKQEGYKPYYIKITFITISAFVDWMQEKTTGQGSPIFNPYRNWMQVNNQLFRNAYEDKYATVTWQEFLNEYQAADEGLRTALALLGFGGCRLSELYTFDGGTVVGKGGKRRPVHLPADVRVSPILLSPTQLRRRLSHNPHAYRKLAADKWARSGVDIKTIQVLLGHTNISSTQRYLRPMQNDELKEILNQAWGA